MVGRWLCLLTGKHIKQLALHDLFADNNNGYLRFRDTHFRNPHLTSKREKCDRTFFYYQHIVSSEL